MASESAAVLTEKQLINELQKAADHATAPEQRQRFMRCVDLLSSGTRADSDAAQPKGAPLVKAYSETIPRDYSAPSPNEPRASTVPVKLVKPVKLVPKELPVLASGLRPFAVRILSSSSIDLSDATPDEHEAAMRSMAESMVDEQLLFDSHRGIQDEYQDVIDIGTIALDRTIVSAEECDQHLQERGLKRFLGLKCVAFAVGHEAAMVVCAVGTNASPARDKVIAVFDSRRPRIPESLQSEFRELQLKDLLMKTIADNKQKDQMIAMLKKKLASGDEDAVPAKAKVVKKKVADPQAEDPRVAANKAGLEKAELRKKKKEVLTRIEQSLRDEGASEQYIVKERETFLHGNTKGTPLSFWADQDKLEELTGCIRGGVHPLSHLYPRRDDSVRVDVYFDQSALTAMVDFDWVYIGGRTPTAVFCIPSGQFADFVWQHDAIVADIVQ